MQDDLEDIDLDNIEGPFILIDADSIYFKAACVSNNKKQIQDIIDRTVLDIVSQYLNPEIKIAVKGYNNFRYKVYKEYKNTRPEIDAQRAKSLNHGYKYMIKKWKAIPSEGMEADDLVSIWAYEAREMDKQYIIASIDKDLLQIPGNHYNYNKKTNVFINDDEAYKLLMIQCLVGDRTDNIPGIKGIGPKKAEKILEGVGTDVMWRHVKKAWADNNAGDPKISLRLLSLLKTWEEYEDVKSSIQDKTPECKQDAGSEGEKILQES